MPPFPALLPPSLPPAVSEKPPPSFGGQPFQARACVVTIPCSQTPRVCPSPPPAPALLPGDAQHLGVKPQGGGERSETPGKALRVRCTEGGQVQHATSQDTAGRRATGQGPGRGPLQRQNRQPASQARDDAKVLELAKPVTRTGKCTRVLPQALAPFN